MTLLNRCKKALSSNGFDVCIAHDVQDAKAIFSEAILSSIPIKRAFKRIETIAAPLNAPKRICNTWSIMEKFYPKYHIKVILIDEDLGL
jgi:hypothetical protein